MSDCKDDARKYMPVHFLAALEYGAEIIRKREWAGLLCLALLAGACNATPDAVPVYREPLHRLVLKRPEARVLDVRLEPNDTSLFHVHAHDIFFAVIDGSRIWSESGTGGVGHVTWSAGYLSDNIQYSFGSKVHRVGNDGDQTFRLIAVENLTEPTCLDSTEMGRVDLLGEPAVEDVRFRAYRILLEPGDRVAPHVHLYPVLLLQSETGQVVVTSEASDSSFGLGKGEWHWEETGIRHHYENRGDSAVTVIEIEVR